MTTFTIPDMSCGHCKAIVEKTIKSLDPAAELDFDMMARTVEVQSSAVSEAMHVALNAAGYAAITA